MSYGIIRVAFVLLSPFWFYYYYGMWKNGIGEQNSSKGHFSEYGRCSSTDILQIEWNIRFIGELF